MIRGMTNGIMRRQLRRFANYVGPLPHLVKLRSPNSPDNDSNQLEILKKASRVLVRIR